MINASYHDMVREDEEVITAGEYLKRRNRNEIDPSEVTIIPPDLRSKRPGAFRVKLKTPRYRLDRVFD